MRVIRQFLNRSQLLMQQMANDGGIASVGHVGVKLPPIVHMDYHFSFATHDRMLIIGDVHGCYDELQLLLEKCTYSPARDVLLFVGDLVNKGPKSHEVVDFVRKNGHLCVRGNHDDSALYAYYCRQGILEYKEGEKEKFSEFYSYLSKFTPEDILFLENLPYTIRVPELETIVVHAGLVPSVPLEEQHPKNMYKMRNLRASSSDCSGDNKWEAYEKPNAETDSDIPWASKWKGPYHLYFGHDAKRGLQEYDFATGLDTGCCYGKCLTGVVLPEKRLVSVPALTTYTQPGVTSKK